MYLVPRPEPPSSGQIQMEFYLTDELYNAHRMEDAYNLAWNRQGLAGVVGAESFSAHGSLAQQGATPSGTGRTPEYHNDYWRNSQNSQNGGFQYASDYNPESSQGYMTDGPDPSGYYHEVLRQDATDQTIVHTGGHALVNDNSMFAGTSSWPDGMIYGMVPRFLLDCQLKIIKGPGDISLLSDLVEGTTMHFPLSIEGQEQYNTMEGIRAMDQGNQPTAFNHQDPWSSQNAPSPQPNQMPRMKVDPAELEQMYRLAQPNLHDHADDSMNQYTVAYRNQWSDKQESPPPPDPVGPPPGFGPGDGRPQESNRLHGNRGGRRGRLEANVAEAAAQTREYHACYHCRILRMKVSQTVLQHECLTDELYLAVQMHARRSKCTM